MPACLRCRTLGRHESATVSILLLCAGPIEVFSAVLAVRSYYGFRSLVCASWCSEEKQGQKSFVVCVPWRPYC